MQHATSCGCLLPLLIVLRCPALSLRVRGARSRSGSSGALGHLSVAPGARRRCLTVSTLLSESLEKFPGPLRVLNILLTDEQIAPDDVDCWR